MESSYAFFLSIQYWAGIRITYAIGSGRAATSSAAAAATVAATSILFQIFI